MKKAIFLDRDGVINEANVKNGLPGSPKNLKEVKILPGVKESILKLKKLSYLCLVITNQPNVSRKITNKTGVEEINTFLKLQTLVDDFFVCYHDDIDNCNCRKPKAGLLISAQKKWDIDFKQSYMIGDRWRDIEAGKKVGCKTIFIDYKYNETKPKNPNFITDSLLNAVYIIEKN